MTAFACAPPRPVRRAPAVQAPPGACDCHAHVIGLPPAHPFVATRSYTPPEATPDAHRALHAALGIDRGVLVTVSVHGDDNRLMAETVAADPDRLRGVAVVRTDVSDADLDALDRAGVRALRINVLFGGGTGLEALEALAPRAADRGWHLELLLDARRLPDLADRIRALPVDVVVDHVGHMPAGDPDTAAAADALEALLVDGRGWVKLSGPYRQSDGPPPWPETLPLARRMLAARPDRCVWGTDWPHVAQRTMGFEPTDTLDWLGRVAPAAADLRAVLVDNPARLYGFPALEDASWPRA